MTILKIGSYTPPTPTELQIGIMDLSKAERNTRGTMIIERIATKQKLEVSWKYLSASNLKSILGSVSSTFFSVTYTDPLTNSDKTGTFYVGDRKIGVMDIRNGVTRYQDTQFSLIER